MSRYKSGSRSNSEVTLQHNNRSEHTTHLPESDGSTTTTGDIPQLKQDVDLEAATSNNKKQSVSRYKSGSRSNGEGDMTEHGGSSDGDGQDNGDDSTGRADDGYGVDNTG